jgi:DNA recombination protein RmuC
MGSDLLALVALLAGLALALGLGWWLWGRPLGQARADIADRREALGRAVAEGAAFRAQAEEARAQVARAAELDAALQASEARAAERERAHAEALAERARVEAAALAERDRLHARQLDEMRNEFQRLAGEALERAQRQFVEGSTETLKLHRAETAKGLETSKVELTDLISPLRETLARYESELRRIEEGRVGSYESLRQMLTGLSEEQSRGRQAVTKLETALRSSGKVAGRWGEEQCRNVLEAAGLVEGVDFRAQVSHVGEAGTQRPDFILYLPGGRSLIVDVKCSTDNYIAAAQSDEPEFRKLQLIAHARAMRMHAQGLTSKDYSKSLSEAVDFIVMFVHGENFLSAAFEHDRNLLSDFFNKRVILAGPVNLIAVARTVAAMRDQARLAQEAAEIAKLGRDLYDSLRLMGGNIMAVQKSLGATVTHFNRFVSQMDSRVTLRAKRFEQLGATTGLELIPDLAGVEVFPQPSQSLGLPGPTEVEGLLPPSSLPNGEAE